MPTGKELELYLVSVHFKEKYYINHKSISKQDAYDFKRNIDEQFIFLQLYRNLNREFARATKCDRLQKKFLIAWNQENSWVRRGASCRPCFLKCLKLIKRKNIVSKSKNPSNIMHDSNAKPLVASLHKFVQVTGYIACIYMCMHTLVSSVAPSPFAP